MQPIHELHRVRAIETEIPQCFELHLPTHRDRRGSFVKSFHEDHFRALGLETHFAEEFFSRSVAGVLRGLHIVTPPNDQVKLVTCVHGCVLDAVLDLRRGSPTFGKHLMTELTPERGNMLYISRGIAHGFYVTSGEAILLYRVSTMYSAEHDKGIRWDSAGISWPTKTPILSARDASLPALADFDSPFDYQGLSR